MIGYLRLPLSWIAHSDRVGIPLMRVAIAIVFLWIGALKFAPYEADSITPFVANSPFMSFFYQHPAEYKAHLTHEGELKPAERAWQTANNTYGFSDGLGTVEITIGLLTLLGVFSRRWGIVGATLSFLTPFVTLSFLITTPDAWVSALGDAQHGFPYLSGGGRLVLKDVMLLAGGLLIMADSARAFLEARPFASIEQRAQPGLAVSKAPHRENGENAVAHRPDPENAGSAQISRASRSRSASRSASTRSTSAQSNGMRMTASGQPNWLRNCSAFGGSPNSTAPAAAPS